MIFQTSILDNRTDAFDSCFNGWLMLKQLTDLSFKWRDVIKMMHSFLPVEDIYPFKF